MNDDELEALLRQDPERLAPPAGSWETITRRARRRRWAKGGVGVAAGAIVLAGAVPAVLAVRHTSDNQTLSLRPQHAVSRPMQTSRPVGPAVRRTSTAAATTVAGLAPTSVSFVSQDVGWLWGATHHLGPGIVAKTTNGGGAWTPVGTPPQIAATDPNGSGDSGIRFADGDTGYVFGRRLFLTDNGAQTWNPVSLPGRVIDLETMNNRVWALTGCTGCRTLHLYAATVTEPAHFTIVPNVHLKASGVAIEGGIGNIAVAKTAAYVLVGDHDLWSTADGVAWSRKNDPCPTDAGFADSISAWGSTDLTVVCGSAPSGGSEAKQVFTSTDSGATWSATPTEPPPAGYPMSISAGSADDIVIGLNQGSGYLTTDGGQHWSATTAPANLSFVGFISPTRVVGVPGTDVTMRAFLSSTDGGQHWSTARFRR
jgi:photosystem II stability/assembly factor-like uncharacterized protein